MTEEEKVINIALDEEGYLEKASCKYLEQKTTNPGAGNYTKYAKDLDNLKVYSTKVNGYPWCAVFVFWCMMKAFGLNDALAMTNRKLGDSGASCTYLAGRYKAMERFYKSDPKPGDQIFFTNDKGKSFNHTGLVTRVGKNAVYTIEGNTSSQAGVVDNGGCVRIKRYSLTYNKIGGYGRPKYRGDEEMTQEQFNKMFDARIHELRIRPATFEQEALSWAKENGIMQGDSTGAFAPKGYITRGETVVLLKRLFDKFLGKKAE